MTCTGGAGAAPAVRLGEGEAADAESLVVSSKR